jgi:hypothetical protein
MSLHVSAPSPHPLGSEGSPREAGGECAIAQADHHDRFGCPPLVPPLWVCLSVIQEPL